MSGPEEKQMVSWDTNVNIRRNVWNVLSYNLLSKRHERSSSNCQNLTVMSGSEGKPMSSWGTDVNIRRNVWNVLSYNLLPKPVLNVSKPIL